MKAFFATIARTFRPEDVTVLTWTATATAVAKICTGIIPIIALVVAVYQIRIQRIRLRTEELKLKEAECHDRNLENK